MPRRLLLDLLAASAGGQVVRARAFLARLPMIAPDFEVVVVKRADLVLWDERPHEYRVIDVPVPSGSLGSIYRMLWENSVLQRHVRMNDIDTFLTFSHYLPRTLPRSLRTIVGVSNLAPFSSDAIASERHWLGRLRLRALERTILASARRADAVIALSGACRDLLIERGIEPGSVSVIPNGVDDPPALASTNAKEREHARPFILYVSHFYPYKNFENLVRAYAALPAAIRTTHDLVLVGRPMDGRYFAHVQQLVWRLGLEPNVRIIPGVPRAQLATLYATSDVFVFPSLVENCPNILLEAMKSGAAIAASTSPPMPEFAADAALSFDPHAPESIRDCIVRIAGDDALANELRERARRRAAGYSWELFTERVIALCRG